MPRGTLQAVCVHQPFDEASRLGLPADTEAELRARQPSLRGVWSSELLPEGPAAAALEVGDILLKVGGEWCTSFVDLEAALDDSVGGSVALTVCRGGAAVERTVRVDDLHALTPSRYIEFGGAVLNELSYQQARNHAMAVKGVYVAHPGYSLRLARVTKGSVICAAGHEETPDLDSLLRVIRAAPHGSRLSLRFYDVNNRGHAQLSSLLVDHKWHPLVDNRRDAATATWRAQAVALDAAAPAAAAEAAAAATAASTAATAASAATASTAADGAAALGEVQAAGPSRPVRRRRRRRRRRRGRAAAGRAWWTACRRRSSLSTSRDRFASTARRAQSTAAPACCSTPSEAWSPSIVTR